MPGLKGRRRRGAAPVPERRRDPAARVAVVLVNWNGATDTLDTLESLDGVMGAEALRVIVVDNGSTDDSVARLRRERPGLEIVETGANLGFAGGNDAGIRKALEGDEIGWVLLLTPTSPSIAASWRRCSAPATIRRSAPPARRS